MSQQIGIRADIVCMKCCVLPTPESLKNDAVIWP